LIFHPFLIDTTKRILSAKQNSELVNYIDCSLIDQLESPGWSWYLSVFVQPLAYRKDRGRALIRASMSI
jgi:hypothetical protein